MQRRTVLLFFFIVSLLVASGCRSRRTIPPPQTAPTQAAAVTPEPVIPVPTPASDFPTPDADDRDVLSSDIGEANRVARERGWIRDAFFTFDASTLDGDARAALESSATWLRSNPEYRIRVEGHCDERGTEQYNLALGDRRAETASSFLQTLGVDASRIQTVSYGEARPFEDGSTEEARAQNRRAHVVLSGRR